MIPIKINNRPFSTDFITGLMLPDGIFEASLGRQLLNAHFVNSGSFTLTDLTVYIESASHPGIVITPATHLVSGLVVGASTLQSWEIDVGSAPAGWHYISFIVENTNGRERIIKKIFVTKVSFNPSSGIFSAETPEGIFGLKINTIIDFEKNRCCHKIYKRDNAPSYTNILKDLAKTFRDAKSLQEICPIVIFPVDMTTSIAPVPAFTGQYGDLPFQDPWWKVLLAIIAFLLIVAAAIAEAVSGTGSVTASTGCTVDPTTGATVCGPAASGGGTSYVAAGLLAAAAAVATVAVASDERDIHRIGQDKTFPGTGEFTVQEKLTARIQYPEPVAPGKPFAVKVNWEYTRITQDTSSVVRTYTHAQTDTHQNTHVLSRYEIKSPDVVRVYKKEPIIVEGTFYNKDKKKMTGDSLFVKCFLIRDDGKTLSFIMQDNGLHQDKEAIDGIYTGIYYFNRTDFGLWKIYVIAQDINYANQNMEPEKAAQIIGGMLLTNQLTISFGGGQCEFVPDGDVMVIA
ncbi:MAG TPA: hypothetical protein VHI78_14030 [Bacteroidales bacterium]|jgi:hypothetical protein|nr:hypothetical protein [Bacteroidales bacterium]